MLSTAQLREMLAMLPPDVDAVGAVDDSPVERAELSAILHAVLSDTMRRSIIEAPLGHCRPSWASAIEAADTALADCGAPASEQAQFDANWLGQRIGMLAAREAPAAARALLTAASHAVEAAGVLLAIARDPSATAARDSWPTAINDLAYAFHLANDELGDLTQPIR
ncbi:hypothetical protein VMT65_32190 [Nocardia sp. CDC153]|uniref:hypothetical protein n=1 Tax=Nocardia sp. CDC153 TaxID=3112167 RepID=UPI002DB70C5C|nr:hypothetical protein [Nocardia sp. CDC153]MEC3957733.1 hypothetical protein [Nocardia sp. CDC153]